MGSYVGWAFSNIRACIISIDGVTHVLWGFGKPMEHDTRLEFALRLIHIGYRGSTSRDSTAGLNSNRSVGVVGLPGTGGWCRASS